MTAVAVIGAATLLLAGLSALAQRDIKRALAYSTISQIGYMFLALGVGAWSAALFHLVTHAAFKALLFLGAGAVSVALHHEHDLFRMGGLWRRLPVPFWTFLVGAASLAGLPLFTAGFFSKEAILFSAWSGSAFFWAAGVAGTLITGLYAFRLVFLAFLGEQRTPITGLPGWTMKAPLVALAALALTLGFVELPAAIAHLHLFSNLLGPVLPAAAVPHAGRALELGLLAAASAASLLGLLLAYLAFQRRRAPVAEGELAPGRLPGVPLGLQRLWFLGWLFDQAYEAALVRPLRALTLALRGELFDHVYRGIAGLVQLGHRLLRRTQAGQLRWYAAGIVLGAVLVLALVVLQ
jgi:NADH-quinone oxidoreductase subunit L